jgi:hypothetical protein
MPPLSAVATKNDSHLIPHYVRNDNTDFGCTYYSLWDFASALLREYDLTWRDAYYKGADSF